MIRRDRLVKASELSKRALIACSITFAVIGAVIIAPLLVEVMRSNFALRVVLWNGTAIVFVFCGFGFDDNSSVARIEAAEPEA